MLLVAFEERSSELPGVDILCRSLSKHEPALPLILATTPALEQEIRAIARPHSQISVIVMEDKRWGYTIKPELLSKALGQRPGESVMWIDTDIVICRAFQAHFAAIPDRVFVSTQEYRNAKFSGSAYRCSRLGVTNRRDFPRTVNSGVIRVSGEHLAFLDVWAARMKQPDFQHAQTLDMEHRPFELSGDQDILTVLLATEFADMPVELLQSGSDIAHELPGAGYTVGERIQNLRRQAGPFFAHAIGDAKPWRDSRYVGHFKRSSIELSLYVDAARSLFDSGACPVFLRTTTLDARLAERASFGRPLLKGLAHAAAYSALRATYRRFKPLKGNSTGENPTA